jgi:hypothetical protein
MRKTTQFLSLDGQVHDTPEKAEDYALNQAHIILNDLLKSLNLDIPSYEIAKRLVQISHEQVRHRSTNTLGNALNWVKDAYIPENIYERDDDV